MMVYTQLYTVLASGSPSEEELTKKDPSKEDADVAIANATLDKWFDEPLEGTVGGW